jgi:hypothetical protein
MSGDYEPTVLDVAKLLYATSGEGPAPEAVSLVNWLIERVPEVRDLWQSVNQPLEGSVTFLDLMELHFCLHNEQESDRAHGMAVWLLRRQLPVLEDKLPSLYQVLISGKDRERLAAVFTELADALRDEEPATPAQEPT